MEPFPTHEGKQPLLLFQPLLVVLTALICGAGLDRQINSGFLIWPLTAVLLLMFWFGCWRLSWVRLAAWILFVSLVTLGSAWHHFYWHQFRDDEIALNAVEEERPICLKLVACSTPCWLPAPAHNVMRTIPVAQRTRLEVCTESFRDGQTWRSCSGRATLLINGILDGVDVGDRLQVFAYLSRPMAPLNPGDFDSSGYERSERRLARLRAPHPECVSLTSTASAWTVARIVSELRAGGQRLITRYVGANRAPLAAAILLGAREQLDVEQGERFFTTGIVHLLAISGLHIGILAAGLLFFGRLGLMPRGLSLLITAIFVVIYALLTDFRPPVVRATVLIVIMCVACHLGRISVGFNSLAAAGVFLFALNPTAFFQSGTQLSFLAVATIVSARPLWRSGKSKDPLDQLIRQTRPWPVRLAKKVMGRVFQFWFVTTLIWIVALPLVMYRFHLVSPIALVLNLWVWIPICIALFSGFGVLLLGGMFSSIGNLCGACCDVSLQWIEAGIDVAETVPGNHYWTSGPQGWWVAGWYLGLAFLVAVPVVRLPPRWVGMLLLGWLALGCVWGKRERSLCGHELTCTFVAVGHGTAVLLELPAGETFLYDAGRLGSPHIGVRRIAHVLWSRGIKHLDGVILSHADADHYNALPQLLQRFSVGKVYVSPVMFKFESAALQSLRESIRIRKIPLEHLSVGDVLPNRSGVSMTVLHPSKQGVLGSDNANSIVLSIEHAQRRVLLPGDLETTGIEQLMEKIPIDYDLVMAPHHGSSHSDPYRFSDWATPEWVVVSAGSGRDISNVKAACKQVGAELLHTASDGAIQLTIRAGALQVKTWRGCPWP